MPADICCCCWLSLAKKRRNKKNTVFLPQCLYQGSSATGMWFFGRFVIFLFPVPPLFFFSAMFVSGKFRNGYVVFRKICDFFYFLFLRFSSSPQCLYQGSSATGMWFFGRFVIFLFPVPPLFFFSAMFVSGKFRDGYVVFRKVCNFFISCSSAFLLLRNVCVREVPRRVCVFWKVYNFFVFPFLSRSSASPLSCSSVFQPPFFVLFPLFLYFYIFLSMYKKTPLSLC